MKKQALYRTFRSKTFSQLVGQNHITIILQNQVSSGNISHAYLFCGTRGTGKTSTAQILARAVNCLDPVGGDPCGVCDICMLADNPDIWEIDAASNNGVDQIRDLRDNVRFSPMESKYKVYIIDEVHMLSTGAFNALLKTLEEPPSHVIFILATTEAQKLPATILSRCQRFDFRRISTSEISQHLKKVLLDADPTLEYENSAIERISHLSDGSMRDALSLLNQCLFASQSSLTLQSVIETIGAVDDEDRFALVSSLLEMNAGHALILVDKLIAKGLEPLSISRDLAEHFRSIAIAISCKDDANKILELSAEEFGKIVEQSAATKIAAVLKLAETFSFLQLDLRRSTSGRLLLETAIIRCSSEDEYTDAASLLSRISALESNISLYTNSLEKRLAATANKTAEVVNPGVISSGVISPKAVSINKTVDIKTDDDVQISAPETSHNDKNIIAQNIFLELQNMQKEGIKRVFSMYEWNEVFQDNTLYLSPPKGCIPALLDSLKSKQIEFSDSLKDKYPDISVVFSPAKKQEDPVPSDVTSDELSLADKMSKLFGKENITK